MSRTQEILDQLNAYVAPPPHDCESTEPECGVPCTALDVPNIWSDVIYQLPEYDPENTIVLGYGAEFALRDGTHIVFDGEPQAWVAIDPDPRADPGWLHL